MWTGYSAFGEADRSGLPVGQQRLYAVLDLRQEVNSGGFDSYFRYWGGDTAEIALDALPGLLGDEWAGLLRDAMSLMGTPYPRASDDRAAMLDAGDFDDAFAALDDRLYRLEAVDDVDGRLTAHSY
ncbi:DMP19 family protein [Agromyces cerinus]|uniref:DNA mimic protein DMP19 C-terminal domain-containing protein n=1 Tax=Agromyces cerinus subsp. cerinus TaxID=232089 RepID=A0A1N6E8G9_9MICO|nr:DUF4375 domain-containing protein [Agromyces cerinus]SIN79320.1 protein of unknown function [Agromyces cerinus subsp. cerinus]